MKASYAHSGQLVFFAKLSFFYFLSLYDVPYKTLRCPHIMKASYAHSGQLVFFAKLSFF